jgi:hypothetical protein
LVVAALDLKLVRLLRAAMRPGCCGAGDGGLIHPAPVIEPRKRFHPEPEFEPRPHVHPAPVFEPRPKLRGAAGLGGGCDGFAPAATVEPAEKACHSASPIEPPWKVLPWQDRHESDRARPVRKIKRFGVRPDIECKGFVIDVFI